MKRKDIVLAGVFVFLIFFIVILSNFKLLFFDTDFYFDEFEKNQVYETFNTHHYELAKTLDQLGNYLAFYQGDDALYLTINNNYVLTPLEQEHMKDVRDLVQKSFFVLRLSMIMFLVMLLINVDKIKKNNKLLKSVFSYSGIVLTGFCLILLLMSFFSFDILFSIFHNIFFSGNWMFPSSSALVMLFPARFFFDAGFVILTRSFLSGIGFILIGHIMPGR